MKAEGNMEKAECKATTCAIHATVHDHLKEQLKPLEHIPTMRVQLSWILRGTAATLLAFISAAFIFGFDMLKSRLTASPASGIVFQLPPPQFTSLHRPDSR
jgi:hypothetical protein